MKKTQYILSIIFLCFLVTNTISGQDFKIKSKKGLYGVKKGSEIIIPFEYDKIENSNRKSFRLKKNDKWGIADERGKILLPIEYDELDKAFSGNDICLVRKDDKWGIFIGKSLRVPVKYDKITQISLQFEVEENGKLGIIDEDGLLLVEPKYDKFDHYKGYEGLAKRGGKWYKIKEGEEQPYTDDIVFKNPDTYPSYNECTGNNDNLFACSMSKTAEFFIENDLFPKELPKKIKSGIVIVNFVVQKDGSITDVEIKELFREDHFTKTVAEGFKMMPKWQPAQQDGKPVAAQAKTMLRFKL